MSASIQSLRPTSRLHSSSPSNVNMLQRQLESWFCPASIHYRWWFGSGSRADCACCLVTWSFTYASVTLVYLCCFRAHRKSQKSLLNSNVAKKKKKKRRKNSLDWHPKLWCDCSPKKQPGRGRGREPRWVQDNGWPEQYITHLQIRFIRINNKEHHDHITLTCNQRFMHFYARNFTGMDFLFSSRFHQPATIYCSGGKQLSEQASLATSLATGTAILHTEKWKNKTKTAEQRQWKRIIIFLYCFNQ